jgi:hypothetical protein
MGYHFRYSLQNAITDRLVFGEETFEKEIKEASSKPRGSRVFVFVIVLCRSWLLSS